MNAHTGTKPSFFFSSMTSFVLRIFSFCFSIAASCLSMFLPASFARAAPIFLSISTSSCSARLSRAAITLPWSSVTTTSATGPPTISKCAASSFSSFLVSRFCSPGMFQTMME